jgi:hypothetical protein
LGTNKIENPFFHWKVKKTLVTKVVGHGKMHIYAKNGVKIRKFAMALAQTMVNWAKSQVKSRLMPFL